MNAKCKIQINEQSVDVVILRGRSELQVFIDGVKQDDAKVTCKFSVILTLVYLKSRQISLIFRKSLFLLSVEFGHNQIFVLKPTEKTFMEQCSLPEDTVSLLSIN